MSLIRLPKPGIEKAIDESCGSLSPVALLFLVTWVSLSAGTTLPVHAQVTTAITPTTGVGNLGTTVTQAAETYNIGGGTRPGAGANLFHSFDLFSVGAKDIANFQNTSGLPTSNILGRVTGGQVSNIFGTIKTIEFPGANLFLMNPVGIVFGPTASLNVGGAVNFTTADYLRLADQAGGNAGIFYATPLQTSVLTTAPVVAFGFLTSTPAPITVQGSNLFMPAGQTLALVGGDVTIGADSESGQTAFIQVPGGQIQIASVASPGEILIPSLNFGPNMNGQSFTALGTITIREGSFLDVSDGAFVGDGSAGSVAIRGGQLVMDSSFIGADHFSDTDAPSPGIKITLNGDLQLSNLSLLFTEGFALGRSGDIDISARNITLADGSFIVVAAFGSGPAGAITVRASESVTLQGFIDPSNVSKLFSIGGPVTIEAPSLTLENLAAIESTPGGAPQSHDIHITVGTLTLSNGGVISLGGDAQTPARITINAQDAVTITGAGEGFGLRSSGIFMSDVSGGGVTIQTKHMTLSDGGHIEVRNNEPGQDRATLMVNATENLALVGNGQSLFENTFISTTGGLSPAGVIELSARNISLTDGSTIFSQSGSAEAAGAVRLQAEIITLANKSRIGTNTTLGSGPAGPIDIIAQQSLAMSDGSILESNSFGAGPAGSVSVTSGNLVSLSGLGTVIQTEARNTGAGGAISITGPTVQISDLASISARALSSGNAGSIQVSGDSVSFSGGARADSSTSGSGQGGATNISATNGLSIAGTGTAINSSTSGSGTGGSIQVQSGTAQVSDAGMISAASTGLGNAGTVNIQTGWNFVMSGGTVATSATQGQGGNITVGAGQQVQMNSNALISASSTGPGNAGDILVSAGDAILLNASKITSEAAQASGGNITLMAPNLIQLVNSTVSSSVQGGVQTIGGNITIDPQFVILQNSQIIAQAFQGQGGNINITAGVLLVDGTSVIDASSQFGVSGTVTIQSPLSNLSQVVNPLQRSALQAAALLRERCAVRAQSGTMSSLTVRGRDVAPAAPGGMLSGSLLSLGPSPGPAAGGASEPVVRESVVPTPALLEISGELIRPFAQQAFGSCGS